MSERKLSEELLHEFAITPGAIEQDLDNGLNRTSQFVRDLLPRTGQRPFIIADLYNGSWFPRVQRLADSIEDKNLLSKFLRILQQIQPLCVKRPDCAKWPGDEDDSLWLNEALASDRMLSIDRIIALHANENDRVRKFDEIEDEGFWVGLEQGVVEWTTDAQVGALRRLLNHSDWVVLVNPYGLGNEIAFTVALANAVSRVTNEFKQPKFEVHVQRKTDREVSNGIVLLKKQCDEHRVVLQQDLSIYPWDEKTKIFKGRVLLAGIFTRNLQKKARWGCSLGHVGRPGNHVDGTPDWALGSKRQIAQWYNDYVNDSDMPEPQTISFRQPSPG